MNKMGKALGGLALLGAVYVGAPYLAVQLANLGLLRLGRGPDVRIALTFDDGPDPETTPQVLEALAAAGVRATFFVLGVSVERFPDLARRIAGEGHEIGSHGYMHRHAWLRNPLGVRADLAKSLDVIEHVTGQRPTLYRPPHGAYSLATLWAMRACGVRGVHWTLEAHDWHPHYGPQDVVRRALKHAEPGGVAVLHDAGPGGKVTAAALPKLLRELGARGYQPSALGDLAGLRPERPADLAPRLLRLVDAAFDRVGGLSPVGNKAGSQMRAGVAAFPLADHSTFAKGERLLEMHVNGQKLARFQDKPLQGVRQTRDSLRELARAMRERPEWQGIPGVFAIGPYAGILGGLGFEISPVSEEMRRRLTLWTELLRRAYGNQPNAQMHEAKLALITRAELLRRYGERG